MKIRRRCKCGCNGITNYGKGYILGHNRYGKKHSKTARRKISIARQNMSEETRRKISLALMGNTNLLGHRHTEETKKKIALAQAGNINPLGYRHSKKTKLKMSLAHQNMSKETKLKILLARIKDNPNYEYCGIWHDREYKRDIRKDYCESINCKNNYKRLCNHHIYLDKKRCAPDEIMTLCNSCHPTLHAKLQEGKIPANPKKYIIINRPDHVSYIHKKSRRVIKIDRIKK